jgi:hypothetical protein
LDFDFGKCAESGQVEKSSMAFFGIVTVLFMLIPVGTMMFMKTFCAFWPFEFMPFAGTEGENKYKREQGKTFHHAPISQSRVKRNTGSKDYFREIKLRKFPCEL